MVIRGNNSKKIKYIKDKNIFIKILNLINIKIQK